MKMGSCLGNFEAQMSSCSYLHPPESSPIPGEPSMCSPGQVHFTRVLLSQCFSWPVGQVHSHFKVELNRMAMDVFRLQLPTKSNGISRSTSLIGLVAVFRLLAFDQKHFTRQLSQFFLFGGGRWLSRSFRSLLIAYLHNRPAGMINKTQENDNII